MKDPIDLKLKYNLVKEKDGSCTLSLEDIDIAVNAATFEEDFNLLINDLREYCLEYFEELDYWRSAPNRKAHLPLISKIIGYKSDDELRKILLKRVERLENDPALSVSWTDVKRTDNEEN